MIGSMARPARLQRSGTWAGVRAGEPVEVVGTRMRGASWTFLAHVRNEASGDEWVEVVGGRGADRSVRSFRPDRVFPALGRPAAGRRAPQGRAGRRQRPSLAEAPQLPLGPPTA